MTRVLAAVLVALALESVPAAPADQVAGNTRHAHKRARHRVQIDGRTREVHASTPGTIEDHGTVIGTPFGHGSIVLVGRFAADRFAATFRLRFRRGSIDGRASLKFTIRGGRIGFVGTARFTGGTGIFHGITSGSLEVHDHNTLDGQHGVLAVGGFATY